MIEFRNVSKVYNNGTEALHNINLKVEKGDTVFLTEMPGGYRLTPYDPSLAEQLDAGREFMREFRDTFHELAK